MNRVRKLSIWTIDEQTLRGIVETSETQSQAIERCGSTPKGTAPFRALQLRCAEFGIDLDPLRRSSVAKVKRDLVSFGRIKQIPIEEILVEGSSYSRYHLKRRLIADGILPNQCFECGAPAEWRGKPLSLILDHINGVPNDHRIGNLRLLCPNCNSQTDTFCGRNKQKP